MITGMATEIIYAAGIALFTGIVFNSFASDTSQTSALTRALSQVTLFAELTDAERDSLRTVTALRRGAAGERIIEQGQTLNKIIIILDGRCEVRIDGEYLLTLSGQYLVGEVEFLDALPGSADVILLEETDLIELNNAALTILMEKQPRLGYVLMRKIAKIVGQRLRDMDSR